MKTIEHKRHTITLYAGLDEMPMLRYHTFGKTLMEGHHIGGSVEKLPDILHQARESQVQGRNLDALKYTTNALNAYASIVSGFSPESLAFGCLLYSIDGEIRDDLTTEGLEQTVKKYSQTGITHGEVEKTVEEAKKKLMTNFPLTFLIEEGIVKPSDILAT